MDTNESSDIKNNNTDEVGNNLPNFLQKIDIPKYIKLLSLIYIVFIIFHLIVNIINFIEIKNELIKIFTYLLNTLSELTTALVFWGIGQIFTIIKNKNEKFN